MKIFIITFLLFASEYISFIPNQRNSPVVTYRDIYRHYSQPQPNRIPLTSRPIEPSQIRPQPAPQQQQDYFGSFRRTFDRHIEMIRRINEFIVPVLAPIRNGAPPGFLSETEEVQGGQIETRVQPLETRSYFRIAIDMFYRENDSKETEKKRTIAKVKKLVSDNLICPKSMLAYYSNFFKRRKEGEECLVCKMEHTKEKLKCCYQAVHPECLRKWWSTVTEGQPIKCLHCQKIIEEINNEEEE